MFSQKMLIMKIKKTYAKYQKIQHHIDNLRSKITMKNKLKICKFV
jgi:uncharacterized protein YaaN involved in tellurite resistance